MSILGIDFGLKNVGLAFSKGELAEPLDQIRVKNYKDLLEKVSRICRVYKIKKIIIGVEEGKIGKRAKKFGIDLENKIELPVLFHSETLTSKEATKKMVEAAKPLKKRQKQSHLIAACLILQDYIDSNPKSEYRNSKQF